MSGSVFNVLPSFSHSPTDILRRLPLDTLLGVGHLGEGAAGHASGSLMAEKCVLFVAPKKSFSFIIILSFFFFLACSKD